MLQANIKKIPFSTLVLVSYFFPSLFLILLVSSHLEKRDALFFFSLGLFIASFFSSLWLLYFQQTEKGPQVALPFQNEEENPLFRQIDDLKLVIEQKEAAKKDLLNEIKSAKQESTDLIKTLQEEKDAALEELEQKTIFLEEYKKTLEGQREVIEKKQSKILELEAKVADLNYEIRTLIQVNEVAGSSYFDEAPPKPQPSQKKIDYDFETPKKTKQGLSKEEASYYLKRSKDLAQKITQSNTFGGQLGRFYDLSMNHYALDMRRLTDSLESESNVPIFLYSPKEKRLLFASQKTKEVLGYNPDKLVTGFDDLVEEGLQEWQKTISQALVKEECEARLLIRSKDGEKILIHALIGLIPTGLFKGNAIAVLFSI